MSWCRVAFVFVGFVVAVVVDNRHALAPAGPSGPSECLSLKSLYVVYVLLCIVFVSRLSVVSRSAAVASVCRRSA